MIIKRTRTPSPEELRQLAALQRAVDKVLEKKHRLGQYAVCRNTA